MTASRPNDEHWLDDASLGAWIEIHPSNHLFPARVGDLVPASFGAYARIFHPLRVRGRGDMRWSEVARTNGVAWNPAIQLVDLVPGEGAFPHRVPLPGKITVEWRAELPSECWAALRRILQRHSKSEAVVTGTWEGRSGLEGVSSTAALLALPHRRYFLARIPFRRWMDSEILRRHGAEILWPLDAAWFLNSDIDTSSSYIGGSGALIAEIVASSHLEAAEAALDDPVHLP